MYNNWVTIKAPNPNKNKCSFLAISIRDTSPTKAKNKAIINSFDDRSLYCFQVGM